MKIDASILAALASSIPSLPKEQSLSDILIDFIGQRGITGEVLRSALQATHINVEVIVSRACYSNGAFLQGNKLMVSMDTFIKLKSENECERAFNLMEVTLMPKVDLSLARLVALSIT